MKKFVYNDSPSLQDIKDFSSFLRKNKEEFITLFHGTSQRHNITEKGLLRTNRRRRNSYQSENGYVYLSVFPSSARLFGEIAYPHDKVCVYQVCVKIKDIKPDLDQIRNKRHWGNCNIGNTLAESLCFCHGARIKRDVMPYELKVTDY